MVERVIGIDVSSKRIAYAWMTLNGGLVTHDAHELGANPILRLQRAYQIGRTLADKTTIIVPEDPPLVKKNADTHRVLCEVLGALKAGCVDARWVHPGMPVSSWKLASVGKGNATKIQVAEWVRVEYDAVDTTDQDQLDAIAIARAGCFWWQSQRNAA